MLHSLILKTAGAFGAGIILKWIAQAFDYEVSDKVIVLLSGMQAISRLS
jgi:hypothetical protein